MRYQRKSVSELAAARLAEERRVVPLPPRVEDVVARFPRRFGLRAFPGQVFSLSERDSRVRDHEVDLHVHVVRADGGTTAFARCGEVELRNEVVKVEGEKA